MSCRGLDEAGNLSHMPPEDEDHQRAPEAMRELMGALAQVVQRWREGHQRAGLCQHCLMGANYQGVLDYAAQEVAVILVCSTPPREQASTQRAVETHFKALLTQAVEHYAQIHPSPPESHP
jgi:hypothetical protein